MHNIKSLIEDLQNLQNFKKNFETQPNKEQFCLKNNTAQLFFIPGGFKFQFHLYLSDLSTRGEINHVQC